MPYQSIREWIAALQQAEELVVIEREVDCILEAGAITRRVYDTGAPAVLFANLQGYKDAGRIFGGPFGLSARHKYARLALALDLPVTASFREITETYVQRRKNLIPPVIVDSAPWEANIQTGAGIDLWQFPAPLIHDGDGGRYIGTWHSVITKDFDTDWQNYGMYRLMIGDRNHLLGLIGARQHLMQMLAKYREHRQPMPFVIAIGTEPVTALISGGSVPDLVSELEVIGAIRGEPVKLCQCKTVDLYAPADAEIVIEGYIELDEQQMEGPFGEYPGYNAGGREPRTVYTVTAICYRDNPIIPMTAIGVPVDDGHLIPSLTVGAEILTELREKQGYPVDFVYLVPEAGNHFCAVSTKVPNKTYVKQLAMAVWSTKGGRVFANNLLIVNDDVDITDLTKLFWALGTRCHPDRGIWKIPNTYATQLLPWLTPEERAINDGASVLFDCTWPADWPPEWVPKVASFKNLWPAELQARVLANWSSYGL